MRDMELFVSMSVVFHIWILEQLIIEEAGREHTNLKSEFVRCLESDKIQEENSVCFQNLACWNGPIYGNR